MYRYVTARGGYKSTGFSRAAYAEREQVFLTILATIAEGIRKGRFFAGVPAGQCKNCDFAIVCGPEAATAVARSKLDDPAYAKFSQMRNIE